MLNQVHEITRITVLGAVLNCSLAILKLAVGLVVGSPALVADAAHSLSDLSTDAFVILGARLSSRPPDESHPFGHGKFETTSAFLVGVALIVVAFFVIYEAGLSLYHHEHNIPGYPVLIVAVASVASKEWIYRVTQRVARRLKSPALRANAWHHRSDALSSVAVLIGGIAGMVGWGHGDQVAAIVVGAMVGLVGLNTLWKAFVDFTEGSIPARERELIAKAIRSVPGVKGWHRMRTRVVGREVFMDLHLLVDGQLSVHEGHEISTSVERAIQQALDRPINVLAHLEPDTDPEESLSDSGQD